MLLKPSVIAIVLDSSRQKILLVKRRDIPIWVLPGGGIDANESPELAVLREVKEETGVNAVILKKVAEFTPINRLSSHTIIYECAVESGVLTPSDETSEVAFFHIDQLPSPFFHIHQGWLFEILNSDQPIHRKLDEISYKALFKFFLKNPSMTLQHLWHRMRQR